MSKDTYETPTFVEQGAIRKLTLNNGTKPETEEFKDTLVWDNFAAPEAVAEESGE